METVLLKSRQLVNFEPAPQNSHPKLSLRRVLYVRLLRWLDKASPQAIWKVLRWGSMFLLACSLWFLPEPTFHLLLRLATWHGFKIPAFLALSWTTLNLKRAYLWLKRSRVQKRGENQFTFEGVPVGELASFLKKNESFKLEDAKKELAVGPKQWARMSAEMKKRGLIFHGENNAQVLRPIGMANLVRQLRDDDLVWSEDAECFVDKLDGFARYQLAQEFSRKKMSDETAKAGRKLERIEKKVEQKKQEHSLFTQLAI